MSLVEGVVLRNIRLREDNLIVTLLTKDAIIPFMVYKVDRFKTPIYDAFVLGQYEINQKGSSLATVSFGEIVDNCLDTKNLIQYHSLVLIREVIFRTQEGLEFGEYNELYRLFLTYTLLTKQNPRKSLTYLLGFLVAYRKLLGYGFKVDGCCICNSSKRIVGYNLTKCGFICEKCFNNYEDSYLSIERIYGIRDLFRINAETLHTLKIPHESEKNFLKDLLVLYSQDFNLQFKAEEELLDSIYRKET